MAPRAMVVSVGYEAGQKRFPKPSSAPSISSWRCNLTGLSGFRNLYFVAFGDQVFVYEPEYPNQQMPSKPAGIIKLQQTRRDIHGYIDRNLPQGINHLIIRELGDEEILLLACDGGDIIGYLVRDIEKAVQSSSEERTLQPQPFFNENVGESGWGLDVHKSERLIAVSSNSHDIQIFAFALAPDETHGRQEPDQRDFDHEQETCFNDPGLKDGNLSVSSQWKYRTSPADCDRRGELDFAWTLRGHDANIPSIAFYNGQGKNDTDVLLTSVDINGVVRLWSVWHNVSKYRFQFTGQMGWGACCIDRATARIVSSEMDAYGCDPELCHDSEGLPWLDISESVDRIPDCSRSMPNFRANSESNLNPESPLDSAIDQTSVDIIQDADDDIWEEPDFAIDPIEDSDDDDDDYENATMIEQLTPHPDKTHPSHRIPSRKFNDNLGSKNWLCNILMAFKTELVFASNVSIEDALIRCSNAVYQEYPPLRLDDTDLLTMHSFERLNMLHQVSELGIVIVGSQAGRVSILTMTYYAQKRRYGFKIEAVVPFKSQEDENQRPKKLLLGIAVGPIQGCQPKAYSPDSTHNDIRPDFEVENRRYRLLLYYYDHTILSYEISHNENDGFLVL